MTAKAKPTFAARLTALRTQAGLSMRQLSEKTGLTIPALWKLEGAGANPRLSTVRLLAEALGVEAKELV